jgi:hypothetical protein
MGSEAIATGSSSGAGIRLLAEQTAAYLIDGERKTVTALCADIKGSMELMSIRRRHASLSIPKPSSKA